ncbi:hypothetical protein [Ruegeria sp. Ofav3-42]|uniref:hypothetical protein n=1 Tax=Ruegeria sp. Ofav3-42 TaxID=2917759 RepID=UPI001EF616EA|nr:hypothetical protein [Ruegeria sp. Ofav3-42]MCG7521926.1 hypothetical protein [Ruegeria sp. Ofav3-42]
MLSFQLTARRTWLTVAFGFAASSVYSQAIDIDGVLALAIPAYHHVDVEGSLRLEGGLLYAAKRSGKAFAVGPNMLLTARHVVGDVTEWKFVEEEGLPVQVLRAANPVQRKVSLVGRGGVPLVKNIYVQTAPAGTFDAAAISWSGAHFESWLDLSVCDIQTNQEYYAVMSVSDTPSDQLSLGSTDVFRLKSVPHEPARYGALHVLRPSDAEDTPGVFRMTEWGHNGSPVLDSNGAVVALVSATLTDDIGPVVLATPIQPLLPGTAKLLMQSPVGAAVPKRAVSCSMGETVSAHNSVISNHVDWDLSLEYRFSDDQSFRPSGALLLSFGSLSRELSIESVDVRVEFRGKVSGDAQDVVRLSYFEDNAPDAQKDWRGITSNAFRDREFRVDGFLAFLLEHVIHLQQSELGGWVQDALVTINYRVAASAGGEPKTRQVSRSIQMSEMFDALNKFKETGG